MSQVMNSCSSRNLLSWFSISLTFVSCRERFTVSVLVERTWKELLRVKWSWPIRVTALWLKLLRLLNTAQVFHDLEGRKSDVKRDQRDSHMTQVQESEAASVPLKPEEKTPGISYRRYADASQNKFIPLLILVKKSLGKKDSLFDVSIEGSAESNDVNEDYSNAFSSFFILENKDWMKREQLLAVLFMLNSWGEDLPENERKTLICSHASKVRQEMIESKQENSLSVLVSLFLLFYKRIWLKKASHKIEHPLSLSLSLTLGKKMGRVIRCKLCIK